MNSTHETPEPNSLDDLRRSAEEWQGRALRAESHLQKILESPSWKITKPFRLINLVYWRFAKVSAFKPKIENKVTQASNERALLSEIESEISFDRKSQISPNQPVAVIAQWSITSKTTHSLIHLIDQLLMNSFQVVLVSSTPKELKIDLGQLSEKPLTVIRKPNFGYDFGSWAVALKVLPELQNHELLFLNDSMYGPFSDLTEILTRARQSPFGITGLTDSQEVRYHVQSYFLHFKEGVIQERAMERFWNSIQHLDEHRDVVEQYEIDLTRTAQNAGIRVGSLYPWNMVVNYWENPTLVGWKELLNSKFPFLKRRIFRDDLAPKTQDVLDQVTANFHISPELQEDIINRI